MLCFLSKAKILFLIFSIYLIITIIISIHLIINIHAHFGDIQRHVAKLILHHRRICTLQYLSLISYISAVVRKTFVTFNRIHCNYIDNFWWMSKKWFFSLKHRRDSCRLQLEISNEMTNSDKKLCFLAQKSYYTILVQPKSTLTNVFVVNS